MLWKYPFPLNLDHIYDGFLFQLLKVSQTRRHKIKYWVKSLTFTLPARGPFSAPALV